MAGCLLLGLLLCGRADAAIETPQFQRFGVADGLPSETVYTLEQAPDGHLWIGTGDGLARFDGVEFTVFQHQPDLPGSLPSNIVQALHVDPAGRVWLGTEGGGLSMLAPDGQRFRHYRAGAVDGLALADVWAIASAPDGAVWFGGYGGGLYRLDPATDTLQAFRHDPADPRSIASDHVLALAVDAAGELWIGGGNGLDRWIGAGFEHHPAGPGGPSAALIFSITADPDGGLWIGSAGGLDRRSADGRIGPAAQRDAQSEAGVTAVLADGPDSFWIATRGGLQRWRDGAMQPHLRWLMQEQRLQTGAMLDMALDHEGGLWFATVGRGLLRLPPNWRDFSVLRFSPERADMLSTPSPKAAAEAADGGLWVVGTAGGLDRIDPLDGHVTRVLEASEMPDRRLWSVLETAAGVWIGHHRGLSVYRPAAGAFEHWLADGDGDPPPSGPVDQLIADGAGGLWLSAYGGGVERRDADGTLLQRYLPGDGQGLVAADTEQLRLGPDGALWLAGAAGLQRRDPASGRLVAVDGGPTGRVHGFAFAGPDMLWTHRLGLLQRWRLADGRLQPEHRIGTGQGLPAVESGGLVIDADGAVWLTSRRGLWRYRPQSGELRRFGVRDGLASHEFVDRPPLLAADGTIAAGSLGGLVLFDPSGLRGRERPPALRMHALHVWRDGERLDLATTSRVSLRHDDRELQVGARLVSFVAPDARHYRFRLLGFDDDWIDAGGAGERVYSRLPPGRYQLQVEGGANGQWSPQPLSLDVEVAPPWWQTGSARLAQSGLLLLALVGGWQLQRRRVARRHADELGERQRQWALQASEAKSRFLATLGHEIRTPMTGVLGMTELMLAAELSPPQRSRAEAIQRSGELMLRLLNDALDLARIEAGKLNLVSAPFDLPALLDEVAAQQGALARRKGLGFRMSIDRQLPAWRLGDRLRLKQVLLNLTGNAIKFTADGFVALRLVAGERGFELQVEDSGPGLSDEQRERLFQRFEQAEGGRTAARYGGSGLGLAISQELVAAMGGRIVVDSAPEHGSCFRVQLDLPACDPAPAARIAVPARLPSGGRRLLLVEDDPVVAEVVAGLLGGQGHRVVHVPHGLAALAELAGSSFDLALLDLDLPGIDGLALARLLRAQGQRLPLLALTARADADAEPNALAAGCDAFLRKPVDGNTLASAIAALCAEPAPPPEPA